MNFNFLSPVSDLVLAHNELLSQQTLGKKIKIHSKQHGIPELDQVHLAIVGVLENRNDVNYIGEEFSLDEIRKSLYSLFPGNWHKTIADLGDINKGETVEDTYFALKTTINILVQKNIIPIVIGGSQDLTYANYRAYDALAPMVNIVNVDSKFDLGDSAKPIKNDSFVGKIILDKPYNLFNYATIGYQTYFNSQEEIDLMDKLYFESYRLGQVSKDITLVEPVLRDANIVSIDLNSVKASEVSDRQKTSPNGLDGKEICAISRYAGISNKVSSIGIYEYKPSRDDTVTSMLVAQMIWYFIEGVNFRVKDDDFLNDESYQKFITLVEDQELVFYKSTKTQRWWIEIPFLSEINNKLKRHTLLPCMHQDYLDACNNKLPERWYKAFQKNCI
ncbi:MULTISPECIES: formimidoylglutamase [Xanthomarina]|jgi:arginase family enzyme|uniref:formimidoylglutamase n=1 Tax=Xanthomarina TaxID=1868329 RepID=UPI000C6B4421|nr:formimidoylglutamase [Xanthomarina sp.]MCB0387527.1 formimidoylglutamase [Winogradskyella sp.]MDX1316244.1 formimidoylglutamase [Xanthomarina gelatinilytica]MAL24100.1 arginase [Xanthomarina sp.]MBF61429.1 arginase [Xanthomarina sp.]HAI16709.1 arginase [Xanthomarina gelatinilytica]|tara:strand:- start:15 stop:1181 length:1167 start_codon:yes stop_codon:yes gene_type:complete